MHRTIALSRLDAEAARELSRSLLADTLPQRWTHVQAVAAEAQRLSGILDVADQTLIVAAAWLHDIGYVPTVDVTGLHALDGARFLRAHGWNNRLCSLVAHHSAAEHGPTGEFAAEQSATSDLLWFVDMTIGHDGRRTTLEGRLAEITTRYGPNSDVSMAMRGATPDLAAAIRRTARRVASMPTTVAEPPLRCLCHEIDRRSESHPTVHLVPPETDPPTYDGQQDSGGQHDGKPAGH